MMGFEGATREIYDEVIQKKRVPIKNFYDTLLPVYADDEIKIGLRELSESEIIFRDGNDIIYRSERKSR